MPGGIQLRRHDCECYGAANSGLVEERMKARGWQGPQSAVVKRPLLAVLGNPPECVPLQVHYSIHPSHRAAPRFSKG